MANLHRVRNTKMRADQLAIHPYAQRERSNAHVKRLAETLDLDAIGTIHAVEYRIGDKSGPWIIDGQHRVLAMLERGVGEWEVNVALHVDVKDDARASELFLALNHRLTVGPYDKFANELRAGNDTAVGISDIVRKFGLRISKTSGDGVLACPASLKKSYSDDDGKSLQRVLSWFTQSHGKKAAVLEGKLIEGATLVAKRYNGELEDPVMVKKLAKYPGGPAAIIGDAKTRLQFHRGSLARAIGSVLIDNYNMGRRIGRLDPL